MRGKWSKSTVGTRRVWTCSRVVYCCAKGCKRERVSENANGKIAILLVLDFFLLFSFVGFVCLLSLSSFMSCVVSLPLAGRFFFGGGGLLASALFAHGVTHDSICATDFSYVSVLGCHRWEDPIAPLLSSVYGTQKKATRAVHWHARPCRSYLSRFSSYACVCGVHLHVLSILESNPLSHYRYPLPVIPFPLFFPFIAMATRWTWLLLIFKQDTQAPSKTHRPLSPLPWPCTRCAVRNPFPLSPLNPNQIQSTAPKIDQPNQNSQSPNQSV